MRSSAASLHQSIHDFYAFSFSDFFLTGGEILGGVVDHIGRTVLLSESIFRIRSCRADQLQTQGHRPLEGNQAASGSLQTPKHRTSIRAIGVG